MDFGNSCTFRVLFEVQQQSVDNQVGVGRHVRAAIERRSAHTRFSRTPASHVIECTVFGSVQLAKHILHERWRRHSEKVLQGEAVRRRGDSLEERGVGKCERVAVLQRVPRCAQQPPRQAFRPLITAQHGLLTVIQHKLTHQGRDLGRQFTAQCRKYGPIPHRLAPAPAESARQPGLR